MMRKSRLFLGILTLMASTLALAVVFAPDKNLHLVACDVGQGDAILAVYGETQILIDGGPGSQVLDCLSRYISFADREIEVVVLTHPQKDHFGGLIDVFKNYQVGMLVANGLDAGSDGYRVLKELVGGSDTKVVNPTAGMVIGDSLIYLAIVHPSSSYLAANTEGVDDQRSSNVLGAYTGTNDPNDFSVVAVLSLGEFDALLTGDIGPEVMDEVVRQLREGFLNKGDETIEYIKVPHHGSKNGLTRDLLELVNPRVAVISVGKNPWGHPHEEILSILDEHDIRILRTDQMGDVEIITDGKKWWIGN